MSTLHKVSTQLSTNEQLVLETIQAMIQESPHFSKKNAAFVAVRLVSLKTQLSDEEVLTAIASLEAMKKIRRYGRPETLSAKNSKGEDIKTVAMTLGLYMSATERSRLFRESQKALGRHSVLLWLSQDEEYAVKGLIEKMRSAGE